MQIQEARPPFVTFEKRAEEDRNASIEAGHYVARDVDYALVTPAGSRDVVERKVEDWFGHLREQVSQGRFPSEWLSAFEHKYKCWANDQEIPENGTPIKTWQAASPAQIKVLLELGVRTVEDLAAANEELLARVGMGARDLKRRAQTWLESSKDVGKAVEALNAERSRAEAAEARIASLEKQLQALQAQVAQNGRTAARAA
jgi:hypothetical protein